MSLFLGSIYSTMELDTSKLSGQINGAKRSLTGLGDEADRAGKKGANSFGSMVGASAIGNIAAMGLTTAIGGITAAAGDSFAALTNLQNSRASFEALTGSTEKASAVMRDLAKYAASSPFEFPQIAQATKTLLGFGSSSDQVGGQMRMLGDVAGATGGDLGAIARVFGQVQAAGKLTAEDFNQLIDNGVAVGDVMANQMGIPVSQLRDEMEKGNLTFDVFNKAMQTSTSEGGKFFGGADKLSQTLTGRISTLKDTFTAMVGTFVGVDFSTGVVQAGGAFDTLSKGIKAATDFMTTHEGAIKKAVPVAQAMVGILGVMTGLFLAYKGAMLVATIAKGAWAAITGIATAATWAFNAALAVLTSPVFLVIAAIVALIAIGYLIVKNWDTIKAAALNVLGAAWDGIMTGVRAVGQFFSDTWTGIKTFFTETVNNVKTTATNLWTSLTTAFSTGVAAVVGFFQQLPYNIGLAIGTIVRFFWDLYTVHIPAFVMGVISWISQLPGKISEFFTDMATRGMEIATNMINSVVGFFSALPGRVVAFVTDMGTRAINGFNTMKDNTIQAASNMINGAISFFSQLPGRVWGAITGMISNVANAIGQAKTALENGARDAINNTVNFFKELPGKIMGAISGLAGQIGNKFKSIASDAWSGFKKGLGIHSPSYIEKSFMAIQAQGTSTVKDLRHDMSDLNRIAATAQRIDPFAQSTGIGGGDFAGNKAAMGSGSPITIQNLNLPNVREPGDFARELKLATVGRK